MPDILVPVARSVLLGQNIPDVHRFPAEIGQLHPGPPVVLQDQFRDLGFGHVGYQADRRPLPVAGLQPHVVQFGRRGPVGRVLVLGQVSEIVIGFASGTLPVGDKHEVVLGIELEYGDRAYHVLLLGRHRQQGPRTGSGFPARHRQNPGTDSVSGANRADGSGIGRYGIVLRTRSAQGDERKEREKAYPFHDGSFLQDG